MQTKITELAEFLFFQGPRITQSKIDQHFQKKTILITGASFGIGEACAKRLSHTECTLVLVARSTDKLLQLKNELELNQCQVKIIVTDLYQLDAAENIFQHLQVQDIQVDILIHNAGKSIQRSIWKSLNRAQDIDRSIAINYINPAQLTRLLLPELKQQSGQILVVSTINAKLFAPPLWSSYQASKVAMQQWILAIQPELAIQQIDTCLVYLPLVRTRMILPTKHYDHMPAMQVQSAANAILDSLMGHKRQWQPWWLILAQIASGLFSTPIYYFYCYMLGRKK
ncbi:MULTISPECIES: SDR family NAD(P)-dependent oxidoreductase [unclassified Acinetobacter]|uniref:SDR family NAD(P)-dependent oxidoreductase n=1 Tax=Acinetobacter TaxID=469 RepID=UPI0018AC17D5|nr:MULTISPECIES: SDR family NAD(P)-dependent oxidoreductase [unclassified Acinetobacter]MBJ9953455.1 SDR family NAD(P)-dependent oxidoreductase [Acinetobacter baumannii]